MQKHSQLSKIGLKNNELIKASIFIGAFFCVVGILSFVWYLEDRKNTGVYEAGLMKIPIGFPVPQIPSDNYPNKKRVSLGKRLFLDTITSRTNKLGCFSCHVAHKAMGDTGVISVGVEGAKGFRNTPSIANIAYHPIFMKDGGVPTLEMQLLVPISDTAELDFNIVKIGDRMHKDSSYINASIEAYHRGPEYYGFVISRSISSFQRTLISGNSRFDQFYYQSVSAALNKSEIRGMNLFMSDSLNCYQCHSGFNFTNNSFQNNGLLLNYSDKGRGRITMKEGDDGKFKVPSLRNIEFSAPYMHNGSIPTLEDVVTHYSKGGVNHLNKSDLINGFRLSISERNDLLNFLKSLSDTSFINGPF